MSSFLYVLRIVLPLISRNFQSLHTLAILRTTCKQLCHDTQNFTQLYRIVLQNTGWMNKSLGKHAFVLTHQDIIDMEYVKSFSLTYLQKIVIGFPQGHLIKSTTLFERSLTKHGSIQGICAAYMKRRRRREKSKRSVWSGILRCSLQQLIRIIQNHDETMRRMTT
jgi:hypothetical protein